VGLEHHGKRFEPAERRGLPPLALWPGQAQPRHPLEERSDGELALHAGQRGAEAEVDSEAEGDVAIVGAGDVETVAPIAVTTKAPFGIVFPPSSTSALVIRAVRCTGLSKRSSSSTALEISPGSRRSRSS